MFNLDGYKSGHCHTYNPDETYRPGSAGNFYALLGDGFSEIEEMGGYSIFLHSTKVLELVTLRKIKIYINSVQHFWPSEDLKSITGQSSEILLDWGEYVKVRK